MKCYLCSNNRHTFSQYICEDCFAISKIIAVYSASDARAILESVCLRNKKQRDAKLETHLKQQSDYRYKNIKGLDGEV
jgi:hypothetical protein